MLKTILYLFLSFFLVIVLTLFFIEFVIQIIPIVYRNIPASKDKVYIYIIGESSCVGEPYCITNENISYYKILEYLIGYKIGNKDIEFIKLAWAGSDIRAQYWHYLRYRYKHPFKKGLAFIYAGKNDWDNVWNNDKEKNISKIKLFNLIKNSIFEN